MSDESVIRKFEQTENEAVSFLRRLEDKLSDEAAWVQCAAARDAAGNDTSPYSEGAVSWCLIGAYSAIGGHYAALVALERACDGDSVHFNNSHTHAEVLGAIRQAQLIAQGL